MMDASYKAAQELYEEIGAKNRTSRRFTITPRRSATRNICGGRSWIYL